MQNLGRPLAHSIMKLHYFFLSLTLAWLFNQSVTAQTGCTDPKAVNYDPKAKSNNGSCKYGPTNVNFNVKAVLGAELQETSGLLYDKGYLWTHNDSGNQPKLYKIDTATGQIVQEVTIMNTQNSDWEDLAQDDSRIFIGDFGNNDGNRTDLKIVIINKADLPADQPKVSVNAQFIRFMYPDQTSWVSRQKHNFDCEAFAYLNEELHLFTKNWADKRTKHYVLPAAAGNYKASLLDSFNVGCTLTGADFFQDPKLGTGLSLIGYDKDQLTAVIWIVWGYKSAAEIWSGNKRKLDLPSVMFSGQVEAIAHKTATQVFISNEKRSIIPARLMGLSYQGILTADKQPAVAATKRAQGAQTDLDDLGGLEGAVYESRSKVTKTVPGGRLGVHNETTERHTQQRSRMVDALDGLTKDDGKQGPAVDNTPARMTREQEREAYAKAHPQKQDESTDLGNGVDEYQERTAQPTASPRPAQAPAGARQQALREQMAAAAQQVQPQAEPRAQAQPQAQPQPRPVQPAPAQAYNAQVNSTAKPKLKSDGKFITVSIPDGWEMLGPVQLEDEAGNVLAKSKTVAGQAEWVFGIVNLPPGNYWLTGKAAPQNLELAFVIPK